jgi:hypothetical protein
MPYTVLYYRKPTAVYLKRAIYCYHLLFLSFGDHTSVLTNTLPSFSYSALVFSFITPTL